MIRAFATPYKKNLGIQDIPGTSNWRKLRANIKASEY
jgi:hypothetical protein